MTIEESVKRAETRDPSMADEMVWDVLSEEQQSAIGRLYKGLIRERSESAHREGFEQGQDELREELRSSIDHIL